MKISSGNYEVINSGAVIGIINEQISITLPSNYLDFNFIFDFIEDKKIEGTPIHFDLISEKTLKIKLINLNFDLTSGNTELIYLGSIKGRELYLNYRILGLQELSYTLIYTFYLKN